MALCNRNTKLADILLAYPQLIAVANRMGVTLGVGDNTVGAACASCGVQPDFFCAVLNTYLNPSYFPEGDSAFDIKDTIAYLGNTTVFYSKVQLPNIDRHFRPLLNQSGPDNNVGLLRMFYDDVKSDFEKLNAYDLETLFPSLSKGNLPQGFGDFWDKACELEEKLADLLHFFVVRLEGTFDVNLCTAVVSAISALSNDFRQNNRIRRRILLPAFQDLNR